VQNDARKKIIGSPDDAAPDFKEVEEYAKIHVASDYEDQWNNDQTNERWYNKDKKTKKRNYHIKAGDEGNQAHLQSSGISPKHTRSPNMESHEGFPGKTLVQ
jgi:hypothetical protein